MTGLAALLAGWAAMRGLNAWRAETVGRRKAELAEEVLAGFYHTRDILTWARFPLSDADQDETAQGKDELNKSDILAPVGRLTQESQVFSELGASRYRFMAYFGEEAARPFDEVRAVYNEIVDSARSLARSHGQETVESEQERDRWEAAIGRGETGGDALRKRLDHAVKAVEQTCRPLIEERHKARRDKSARRD